MREFPRPTILVSRCLGFAPCRYDGQMVRLKAIQNLEGHADFIPVCPELEIGLPVPRSPLRIVRMDGVSRLIQKDSGRDFTEAIEAASRTLLQALGPVDAVILKGRSATCGLRNVITYPGEGPFEPTARASGVFGSIVAMHFPELPVEEEGSLNHPRLLEHFYAWLFASTRLRLLGSQLSMHELLEFHSKHKYQLMALNPAGLKALGSLVANHDHLPVEEVFVRYRKGFAGIFQRPPRTGTVVNALMHCFGYFGKQLQPKEKQVFLKGLEAYRNQETTLDVPVRQLRSFVERFPQPYLQGQSLLEPYPEALMPEHPETVPSFLRKRPT